MKTIGKQLSINFLLMMFVLASCENNTKKLKPDNMVFQNSTINALLEGLYQGDVTFAELKEYGDFGLGTFQNLDGEMIGFDGVFYQIKSDESIHVVADEQLTPFSVVTHFKTDKSFQLNGTYTYEELKNKIDAEFPSENFIYAMRVEGIYSDIETRSVPMQKESIRLIDVIDKQNETKVGLFNNPNPTKGTLAGFCFPPFLKDINVVGHHFHFLSEDKKIGGHVFDLKVENPSIKINYIYDFQMILPKIKEFEGLDLTKIEESELDTVEKK